MHIQTWLALQNIVVLQLPKNFNSVKTKYFLISLIALLAFIPSSFAQNINTIAGTGSIGFSGDGSAATSALFNGPQDVSLDTFGNVYIADAANQRIRKITAATGIITTIAGTGSIGYSGDGGAASSATFNSPIGIDVDAAGNVYIADVGNHCIRKITAATGFISTVAGIGSGGFSGDGGAATAARLQSPYDVTVDASGNLFIADVSNNCIRKVTASTGVISTVAGTTSPGFSGDGAAATLAKLYQPFSVAIDASNNLYIADAVNNRIRKVTASTGVISTIAGIGTGGFSGDGGAATSAQLNKPYSIDVDNSGNVYFSDFNNQRIRKITTSTGLISTIAGTGSFGFSGDGGLAIFAQLANPKGIYVDKVNNVFIADDQNSRVRFICNAATIPAAPLVSSPLTLCTSSSPAPLTAIGTTLKWYTTAIGGTGSTTAPTPSVASTGSTTYYVTQSSACGESPRAAIVVNVVLAPTAPTAKDSLVYCSGVTALPLTASGSATLFWYNSASGGTGSTTAPTPSTALVGTTIYYVSQGTAGCESSRLPIKVIVNPTPVAPSVSDIRYCLGASAMPLSATGTNLKWYTVATGGTATTTAPTPSTAIDGSVLYFVSQSNSFACESGRASINVSTNTKPKVTITASTAPKFFVCKGSKLTLESIALPYGINYQWQFAGADILGAIADTFNATDAGIYRVIVSNAPNCNDTASVLVDIDSSFTKTSINPINVNICDGVNIKLFSTSSLGAGYKYQWLKDGLALSDTNSSIVVSLKGVYELKVTNPLGCVVTSNSSTVNTFSPIPQPIISQLGGILSVAPIYASYQWYRNGKVIVGASSSAFTMSFDGDYSVAVTDVNGCENESDIFKVQNLSLAESSPARGYSIYPNPSVDFIHVQSPKQVVLKLSDLVGKTIYESEDKHSIDISALAAGLYFLQIAEPSGKILGIEKITKANK